MPRKGDKVFCINHPDEELSILNEHDASTFHVIRLGYLKHGSNFGLHNKSTGFDVFGCRKCGYVEFYLTAEELQVLSRQKT
ncbi:MAG: hypothetical protein A4E68_01728 [Syntrophaceae bacterium PtaB.Bin095]|nr:MAG: hypothetical protein A4E68_01728 [Syntrophaceae bacterium PtaB.Bin095]